MPAFSSQRIAVMVDMAGCPNRCRHCWLGNPPNRRMSEELLRAIAQQFHDWIHQHASDWGVTSLGVFTWYREPDFAAHYRDLWELEKQLSDEGEARRFELLSIWRLAHDESYARWARDIGTEACQITFFGLEENTDYFTRRRNAFRDNLLATERLLAAGIRPRWQFFLTQCALADLEGFVALIDSLRLEDRVRALDHEFEVFVRTPAPDGEAFNLEDLRPTATALSSIPKYLAEKTERYQAATLEACFGSAEKDWLAELLQQTEPFATQPDTLGFMVTPELDVFSNIAEPLPWWNLGNLKSDGLDQIMQRFQGDAIPGLRVNFHVPVSQLAETYGDRASERVYAEGDLVLRWMRMWGEDVWRSKGQVEVIGNE